LYKAVSGSFDRNYWHWIFKKNPSGHGHIWLAEEEKNNDIVGQYAVIPTDLIIQGKKILGSQSLGTMTHPSFRKQGIFTHLARDLFEDSAKRGVDLIYGFPNKNSCHGFLKYLDFFILSKPILFSRPLDFGALLNVKIKSKLILSLLSSVLKPIYNLIFQRYSPKDDEDIHVKLVESFPEDIDEICHTYNSTFKNTVARSVEYLNWRYCDRPDRSYRIYLAYKEGGELSGYCVYGRTERDNVNIGLIMDLFANPEDVSTLKALICHVLNEMEKEGEDLASCLLQRNSPFLKVLRKCGFIFPLTRFPPYILRLNSDNLKLHEINNLDDWHITFGDADFI
jgi:GNAT superfamily N-acetyltransferase